MWGRQPSSRSEGGLRAMREDCVAVGRERCWCQGGCWALGSGPEKERARWCLVARCLARPRRDDDRSGLKRAGFMAAPQIRCLCALGGMEVLEPRHQTPAIPPRPHHHHGPPRLRGPPGLLAAARRPPLSPRRPPCRLPLRLQRSRCAPRARGRIFLRRKGARRRDHQDLGPRRQRPEEGQDSARQQVWLLSLRATTN